MKADSNPLINKEEKRTVCSRSNCKRNVPGWECRNCKKNYCSYLCFIHALYISRTHGPCLKKLLGLDRAKKQREKLK